MLEHNQEILFSSLLSRWGDLNAEGTSIRVLTGPPLSDGFFVSWLMRLRLLLYFSWEMPPKASGTSWWSYSKSESKWWDYWDSSTKGCIDKMGYWVLGPDWRKWITETAQVCSRNPSRVLTSSSEDWVTLAMLHSWHHQGGKQRSYTRHLAVLSIYYGIFHSTQYCWHQMLASCVRKLV